jgi:hypothetical protein
LIAESLDKSNGNKYVSSKKGKAAVDDAYGLKSQMKIYEDASGNQYSAYLMKSNIENNNNKYYILQLH